MACCGFLLPVQWSWALVAPRSQILKYSFVLCLCKQDLSRGSSINTFNFGLNNHPTMAVDVT